MGQGRRQFTDESKQEAVALLASSGRPLLQLASELGISLSMLRNWRNRSEGRNAGPTPHSAPGAVSEIFRLRRENDHLQMERDILKDSSRGFVPPVAVETGGVSLAAERKRPSASWWQRPRQKTWPLGRCTLESGDVIRARLRMLKDG